MAGQNSNTTLVKVNQLSLAELNKIEQNSNTTLVKVNPCNTIRIRNHLFLIQIQLLLKLIARGEA